jgi:hypothetical protein
LLAIVSILYASRSKQGFPIARLAAKEILILPAKEVDIGL